MSARILHTFLGAALALVLAACATDDGPTTAPPFPPPIGTPSPTETPSPSASASPLPNACPTEGCQARIETATLTPEGELTLTLTANFAPDISRNHFHIYWDTYTAQQVSDDAEPRFSVTPGDWVPTDANPYTTADAASVTKRGASTKLCVTVGDRNHNVLDPAQQQCYDAGPLL